MSKYIKYVLIVLLYITIVSVTIIPKLISWVWYRQWDISKSICTNYIFGIFEVVFSIVDADDLEADIDK